MYYHDRGQGPTGIYTIHKRIRFLLVSFLAFRFALAQLTNGCPTAPIRYGTVQFVFTCGGADGVMGVNKDPRLKSYYEQPCA